MVTKMQEPASDQGAMFTQPTIYDLCMNLFHLWTVMSLVPAARTLIPQVKPRIQLLLDHNPADLP